MGKMHDALRKAEGDRARRTTAVAPAPAPTPVAPPPVEDVDGESPAAVVDAAAPLVAPPLPSVAARRPGGHGDVDAHLVLLTDPHSAHAEQYRAVRTNILAMSPEKPIQIVVVTSSVPSEGKSVSSVNLACTMAEELDRKVVLIDADMRKPTMHKLMGLDNQRGLSDYLTGGCMLEMVLQRCRLPNLWVLPSGRVPPNPAELLGGKRMDDLLARLRRDYDFVVIDSPPVISTTDPGVISPRVDGTVLVVRMEKTPRDVSKRALEQLKKARANVLGTLLTGLEGDVKDYYYYPYDQQQPE